MVAPPQQWRPARRAFGTMGGQGFGRAVPQYGFRPNFVARRPPPGDPVEGGFPGKRQGHDMATSQTNCSANTGVGRAKSFPFSAFTSAGGLTQ